MAHNIISSYNTRTSCCLYKIILITKFVLSVNPARKQQVSSVPAKHLFHDRVLWLRRRLNLVFSDFMRRCVSHRSGMRTKAMPPACFLEWNMFMLDTGNLVSCHKQKITGNYHTSSIFLKVL